MKRSLAAAALVAVCLPAATAGADLLELRWTSEGYYRTRAIYLTNLARQPRQTLLYPPTGEEIVLPEIRRTSYIMQRLRLAPSLSYGNLASLHVVLDAFDDVLWGDNNGLSSAPLFSTDGSNQGFLGSGEQPSVKMEKAWVQFQVPVGLMRVGRMPSHWGMGLLANGGGNAYLEKDPERPKGMPPRKALDTFFDDDFGDNHFGSVADRILFVTKPLTIYKTIRGEADTSSKLIVGYAYDKITEAPLLAAEPFQRRFRPFGQQGFISRGKDDDINEHVFLWLWNDPYPDLGGPLARYTDEMRFGMYGVFRHAQEGSTNPSALDPNDTCGNLGGQPNPCVDTGSKIWIVDFWGKLRYGPLYGETELLYIGGKTFGGVPFPSPNEKKKANISGGVLRLGYFGTDPEGKDLYDGVLELGHASGDDELEDSNFKQRALHPDYNVGLVLFEEILRELSARTFRFYSEENPEGAIGLTSKGGVINANYINPRGHYHLPVGNLTAVGGLLFAWVDEPAKTGTAMFFADELCGDPQNCGFFDAYLGTEIDLGLKTTFAGHMDFSLESGLLFFGDALKSAFPNADSSFTLQSRLAFVW